MPASTVLIIAINASELSSPTTAAMVRTVSTVLGPSTTVRVEATESGLGAAERVPKISQDAWIIIDWLGPQHQEARLHGYVPASKNWLDRSITFAVDDPDDERGRTIGFVISAMFSNGAAQAVRVEVPTSAVPAMPQPVRPRAWVTSLAASAGGVGVADSFGAMASLERGGARARLGLLADARFGTIPLAQASTRFLSFGVIGMVRLLPTSGATWVGLTLCAGISHIAATHLSEDDDAPVGHAAWMPMTSLQLRATRDLSKSTAIFVETGPEYRFGSIDVYVHGENAARIPALIGALRLGMSARF